MKQFEGLNDLQIKNKLNSVDAEIKKLERSDKFIEAKYGNLLQERIILSEKLNNTNEVVEAAKRGDKYPSIVEYKPEGKTKIVLEYKNMFLKEADTMVSAIHVDNGFEPKERTATREFIVRNGREDFQQPKEFTNKEAGDFVILKHSNLSAPISHHILYYRTIIGSPNLNVLDLDVLEKGIEAVLKDCEERGLKTISFFPLGFDYILQFPAEKRAKVATMLADRIAETIVQYIKNSKSTSIRTIYLGFISYITMRTLDNAFHKWTAKTKQELFVLGELTRVQKILIEKSYTDDEVFKEELRELSYTLNDKATILLLGETGVGKSYICQTLHENSSRASKPFISINCAILKKERAESALFGHAKGAFSDARKDVAGVIERANGGILFLDEIGTLELDVQKMLLTFLDEGYFYRLGDYGKKRYSDVKIILGTNSNLRELVGNKEFAHDLYERIHQRVFEIPPLRERRGDIKTFAKLFCETQSETNDFPIVIDGVTEILSTFDWYGNIRELKFYVEKLYSKCKNENRTQITKQMIKDSPPRNEPLISNDYLQLEKLLRHMLVKWDPKYGNFLGDIVEPIAAKIYIDDLDTNLEDSSAFLGIEGTKGKISTLKKRYAKYSRAIKILKNI